MAQRQAVAGRRWLDLFFILAAGFLLAWFASATPKALPAAAPPDQFSAGRAMLDIGQLAQAPHPVGSLEDDRVRSLLVAKLADLRLGPQVRCFDGVRAWGAPPRSRGYHVCDVLARAPGFAPHLPSLLLLSHYDSVARSPGAADDMAGVAAELEMARLLRLHPPRRDVMFAFTDGEEAGLVGARALLADPVFLQNVGLVVNMDVRGGGGRALMFQTGLGAGGLQRFYAAHGLGPAGNSLAAYLYEILPKDTDFTVALAHGLTGLNYAFIGRPALYHTPAAVPQSVEAGAVQSLGAQVWALVQPLAAGESLPVRGPDLTWFDLFGRWVVIYPPAVGWLPVFASALLIGASLLRSPGVRIRATDLATGAAQSLGATVLAAAVLYAYARLGLHGYYNALARAAQTEVVTAVVCLGAAALVFQLAPPTARPQGRWIGATAVAWLIALCLQAAAPRTAFLAEWPVVLAGLALLSTRLGGRTAHLASLACGALALGFLLEIEHLLVLGVGVTLPPIGAAVMPLALAVLAPFLQRKAGAAERSQRPSSPGADEPSLSRDIPARA